MRDGLYACSRAAQDGEAPSEEERERATQLLAQTGPVTERKHFYRTEVHQIQDVLLCEKESVNKAIALGAAFGIMQTTAARSGMFTIDEYDKHSSVIDDKCPLKVRDVKYALRELLLPASGEGSAAEWMLSKNANHFLRQAASCSHMRDRACAHAAGLKCRLGKIDYNSSMAMARRMVKHGLTPISCEHSDRGLITASFKS